MEVEELVEVEEELDKVVVLHGVVMVVVEVVEELVVMVEAQ